MSHTLTEGGQITSHRLRMLRQVMKVTLVSSITAGLCAFFLLMSKIPKFFYKASWYYLKAFFLHPFSQEMEVSREFLYQATRTSYHYNPKLPIDYVQKLTSPLAYRLLEEANSMFWQACIVSGICSIGILLFFFYRGRLSKDKKHLSGSKIISPKWIGWRLKLLRKASPIKIGTLPLIKGSETQHLLITGGTGSGKSNCLHHVLNQIRFNKQKAIIVDTSGIFLQRYFREGKDILLNPFDTKSIAWSPWAEGCSMADYASLADAFIPVNPSDNESYWKLASKTVFISLLAKFSDSKKTSELTRWLQYEKLGSLCKLLEGTKAAAHMDLSSEKTASSIRSVASTFLECLEVLKDTENPFSIRDWIAKQDDSWLFLQCHPEQRSLLRPLLSAWISSAVRGLLALPVDLNRRIWFSIDELPSLQRIKDLETLLTEGRKYGGCALLALQSPAQLENIYGRELTKVIIGNTATKIIFKERDPGIAESISRAFGEREVIEIQEGITYGAHEARDGVSLSMQNKTRPVVSATQILELPLNMAYIKLAANQIARIKLKIAHYP